MPGLWTNIYEYNMMTAPTSRCFQVVNSALILRTYWSCSFSGGKVASSLNLRESILSFSSLTQTCCRIYGRFFTIYHRPLRGCAQPQGGRQPAVAKPPSCYLLCYSITISLRQRAAQIPTTRSQQENEKSQKKPKYGSSKVAKITIYN